MVIRVNRAVSPQLVLMPATTFSVSRGCCRSTTCAGRSWCSCRRPGRASGVLDVEAGDVHRAVAVVLEHLVAGRLRAAADDVLGAAAVPKERRGVLADVLPPHVLDGARAQAVDAVTGGRADDDVLDGRAVGELEDRVLALALPAVADAAVALQPAVEARRTPGWCRCLTGASPVFVGQPATAAVWWAAAGAWATWTVGGVAVGRAWVWWASGAAGRRR